MTIRFLVRRPAAWQVIKCSVFECAALYVNHAGSLTQSALEDAFLDMAGSRLDASKYVLDCECLQTPLTLYLFVVCYSTVDSP